jgi:hypothetical protein
MPVQITGQCCGTVKNYCGSGFGSYLGKVLVPVRQFYYNEKICTNSSLFNARSSTVPQKVGL